jgi:putative transposase
MPRPPRLHVPGGFYHVMLRGNHREALFASANDRSVLNEIVADALERAGSRMHAFCWMTNHLHALIQVGEAPLGRLMKRIATRYSRYRHRQLNTTGHLFERRYKALLVDVDAYFIVLLRYIHLNPVSAGLVSSASDYPWSSHHAYLGEEQIAWLDTQFGLSLLGRSAGAARNAYRSLFADAPFAPEVRIFDQVHPEDSRVLGTDQFLATLRIQPYQPRSQQTLDQLAEILCKKHGITVAWMRSPARDRRLTPVRIELALQALDGRIASLKDIAEFLGRRPASLSELLTRHRHR